MHQTTMPIRAVAALRDLADSLEAEGPNTPMQGVLNTLLSNCEGGSDGDRILTLLLLGGSDE